MKWVDWNCWLCSNSLCSQAESEDLLSPFHHRIAKFVGQSKSLIFVWSNTRVNVVTWFFQPLSKYCVCVETTAAHGNTMATPHLQPVTTRLDIDLDATGKLQTRLSSRISATPASVIARMHSSRVESSFGWWYPGGKTQGPKSWKACKKWQR